MKKIDNYWLMENKRKELDNAWYAVQRAGNILAYDGQSLAKKISDAWAERCRKWEQELNQIDKTKKRG